MIRILQVIGSLGNGGSQAMIMNLYRNIDRSKIQFDFIIDRPEEQFFSEEIKNLGGKIYILPSFKSQNILNYKKSWRKFFEEYSEYKIIHGHVRSTAAIYLKIAKEKGLVAIAHSHSTSSGSGFSSIVKNIMQYPIRYIADYLFACSYSAGEWLFGKKACKKNNFFIQKNAIDSKRYIYNNEKRKEKRKELQIENKYVIGHVGRFDAPKNHEFLIDVFKKVHDRNNKAVLMLIGDGNLRTFIEEKVEELEISDSVIFTGIRSDIPELLNVMDLFLFPSLFEGLGIVVIEAQACGLKCIVSNTVPKEAYVTDLIESIDLKASDNFWAKKILEYPSVYVRQNTYEEICQKGYDIISAAQWLQDFYLKIIKVEVEKLSK